MQIECVSMHGIPASSHRRHTRGVGSGSGHARIETLEIYELGSIKFTTQNDPH